MDTVTWKQSSGLYSLTIKLSCEQTGETTTSITGLWRGTQALLKFWSLYC